MYGHTNIDYIQLLTTYVPIFIGIIPVVQAMLLQLRMLR